MMRRHLFPFPLQFRFDSIQHVAMLSRLNFVHAISRRVSAGKFSTAAGAEKLIIFDTTLRDGEQSPGCTLQLREKVAIAHQLSALGVDVCEAGFPIASPGDFEAVRTIAREVGPVKSAGRSEPMIIAGLARATEKDIDRCFEAVREAPRHRIHTFLATSDIHVRLRACDGAVVRGMPARLLIFTAPLPLPPAPHSLAARAQTAHIPLPGSRARC